MGLHIWRLTRPIEDQGIRRVYFRMHLDLAAASLRRTSCPSWVASRKAANWEWKVRVDGMFEVRVVGLEAALAIFG